MERQLTRKNVQKEQARQDLLTKYLAELDDLVNKYPQDPNKTDLDEGKLNQLIDDLDTSWINFRKRWQTKVDLPEKAVATGKVKKDKKGIRHLIIKSEFTDKNVLDLIMSEDKK